MPIGGKNMENDAATLYCPNELCQAPNPLSHKFCQRCSTPLCKLYLWTAGYENNLGQPGDILADRYLVVGKSILLDRIPGLALQTPAVEKLEFIKPYLKLIPYRLHVPQVYGLISIGKGSSKKDILLLEAPPVYPKPNSDLEVNLRDELTTAWGGATSMRQLNWLWQIANLWQPLLSEGVASTLMEPYLMRVEGPILRLLELRKDGEFIPTLTQLGEFWRSRLLPFARNAIAEFLSEVCRLLIEKEVHSGEQLILLLDRGLKEIGHSQSLEIKIATQTDTGPSRQRNEDACYPPSKNILKKSPESKAMGIVCDGIGGHEGGNVASNLAIKTIEEELNQLNGFSDQDIEPAILLNDLEKAVAIANDKISERNDSENRQGRQRMGTTLVMALPIGHEIYVTHVGDSRAYWITRHGCHQVTLDDDVASREVRLGYAVYRDALKQVASGSLVQALGMSPSLSLHPTVQRFVVDEDGVFLLCSDGLSDFDRVEQHWETEVLPVLAGKLDLATATSKLVEIANLENGHDNVTIALLHYQVKYSEPKLPLSADLADVTAVSTAHSLPTLNTSFSSASPNQKTQVLSDTISIKKNKVPLSLVLPILVLGGGFLGYLAMQLFPFKSVFSGADSTSGSVVRTSESESVKPVEPPPTPKDSELKVGSEITTEEKIEFRKQISPEIPIEGDNNGEAAMAPKGSVLEVIDKKPLKNSTPGQITPNEYWLKLRVCITGESTNTDEGTNTGDSTKVNQTTDPSDRTQNQPKSLLEENPPVETSPDQSLLEENPQGDFLSTGILSDEKEALLQESPLSEFADDSLSIKPDQEVWIKPDQEVWIRSSKISLEPISISQPEDPNTGRCLKVKNTDTQQNKVSPQNGVSPTIPGEPTNPQPPITPSKEQLQFPPQTPTPVN